MEVSTAGCARLLEHWYVCMAHLTGQLVYLINRDVSWGLNPNPVRVIELPVPSEDE